MIIGSFDCGWGLPTLIRVLILALKYMDVCLFLFPFCFGGVLKAVSIAVASLTHISGDLSPFYSFPLLPVEILVSTVSLYGAAILGCFFPFCFYVSALAVTTFIWAFLAFFSLLCSLFSLGVCAIVPCSVLGSEIWPSPPFSWCPFCAWISCVLPSLVSYLLQCVLPPHCWIRWCVRPWFQYRHPGTCFRIFPKIWV